MHIKFSVMMAGTYPWRDFIGSWGPRMTQLAGEIASGRKADCSANPVYLRDRIARVHAGATHAGRDATQLEITVGPLCSVAREREHPRYEMRRSVRQSRSIVWFAAAIFLVSSIYPIFSPHQSHAMHDSADHPHH